MVAQFPVSIRPALGFGLLLLAVILIEWLIIRQPVFTQKPLLPAAVSFDVLVGLPVLFYLLIARPYRLPVSTVAAAFVAAVALGHWLIPGPQQQYVRWAGQALGAVEVLTFTLTLLNLRRLQRAYQAARPHTPEVAECLTAAFRQVFGRPMVPLVFELMLFYYALLSWRAQPVVSAGSRVFTNYQNSACTAYLGTVALLSVAEMGALHLLLVRWYPLVAGAALVLHLYGLLLLLAHARAVRLLPVQLTADQELVVRVGFFWTVRLPRAALLTAQLLRDTPAPAPGRLNLARPLLTPPNLLLVCASPQPVTGPYGLGRTACELALYVDDAAGLLAALALPPNSAGGPVFGNKP
ncbi:hypothetical protein ACFPAF_10985 [Hymenobacter endophyticus]|uniref:Uncharacterized protein n=1 Tax=Hymenobacter endophyticus TaxID=3076335 RepID=A0ABU3THR6_9BACT|nr:hypothetical protein [Hymenobacter endophyticus]MDU0370921.1 hypothetical protein [Hymenobacter endophyticus]